MHTFITVFHEKRPKNITYTRVACRSCIQLRVVGAAAARLGPAVIAYTAHILVRFDFKPGTFDIIFVGKTAPRVRRGLCTRKCHFVNQ